MGWEAMTTFDRFAIAAAAFLVVAAMWIVIAASPSPPAPKVEYPAFYVLKIGASISSRYTLEQCVQAKAYVLYQHPQDRPVCVPLPFERPGVEEHKH